jgi:hypothetical protein
MGFSLQCVVVVGTLLLLLQLLPGPVLALNVDPEEAVLPSVRNAEYPPSR